MSKFYFAWVDASETTFGEEHYRVDEDIQSFEFVHDEGAVATLSIAIKNPRVGPLAPGRKLWAWLAWDDGSATITPIGFFQLVGIPTSVSGEVVTYLFVAQPEDFSRQKQLVAESLKQLPEYDPIFIDAALRDDPDTVLEGYSSMWHIDRITHEVSTSDILVGEDGVVEFMEDEVPYDSVDPRLSKPPLLSVAIDSTVPFTQRDNGSIAMGNKHFFSYGGEAIFSGWPKAEASVGSGWIVDSSSVDDVDGIKDAMTASWSGSYESKAKEHVNGDVVSVNWSVTKPIIPETALTTLLTDKRVVGVMDPFSDPQLNIQASVNQTSIWVPLWHISASMAVRYEAARSRTERVRFTLSADVQPVLTHPDTAPKIVQISGADVALPIFDVLNWETVSGQPVAVGDVVTDGASFQIAVVAGTAGSTLPAFDELVGETTLDGTVLWASVGTSMFSSNVPGWVAEDFTPLGQLILPRGTTAYQLCTTAGTTSVGPEDPEFAQDTGDTTLDGTVVWTSLGTFPVPIGNPARRSYFPTDRGLDSLRYLICVARSHLLMGSRVFEVSFDCRMERIFDLSCRKNAIINDRRLPGGQALGKITSYGISADGPSGKIIGNVTVSCAIGNGNAIEEVLGDPDIWEDDVVEEDVQHHDSNVVVLSAGDVGFSTPVENPNDDGLVFPLTKDQAVFTETVHGSLDEQKAAIIAAFRFDQEAANTPTQASSPEQSIANQKKLIELNKKGVASALDDFPIWYELELNSVTNGPFDVQYDIAVTDLMIQKMVDLEAPAQ